MFTQITIHEDTATYAQENARPGHTLTITTTNLKLAAERAYLADPKIVTTFTFNGIPMTAMKIREDQTPTGEPIHVLYVAAN